MNLELEQEFKVEMKAGKIDRACQRYDLGRNTMRRIAEAAGAVIRMQTTGRAYADPTSTDTYKSTAEKYNVESQKLEHINGRLYSSWFRNWVNMAYRLRKQRRSLSNMERKPECQVHLLKK